MSNQTSHTPDSLTHLYQIRLEITLHNTSLSVPEVNSRHMVKKTNKQKQFSNLR